MRSPPGARVRPRCRGPIPFSSGLDLGVLLMMPERARLDPSPRSHRGGQQLRRHSVQDRVGEGARAGSRNTSSDFAFWTAASVTNRTGAPRPAARSAAEAGKTANRLAPMPVNRSDPPGRRTGPPTRAIRGTPARTGEGSPAGGGSFAEAHAQVRAFPRRSAAARSTSALNRAACAGSVSNVSSGCH